MKESNNQIADLRANIMKRLLIVVVIVSGGIFVWMKTSRCHAQEPERSKIETPVAVQCKDDEQATDNECQCDSRTAPSEPVANVFAPKRPIVNKSKAYFNNITLRGDWMDWGDECNTSMLIRYIDNTESTLQLLSECATGFEATINSVG